MNNEFQTNRKVNITNGLKSIVVTQSDSGLEIHPVSLTNCVYVTHIGSLDFISLPVSC